MRTRRPLMRSQAIRQPVLRVREKIWLNDSDRRCEPNKSRKSPVQKTGKGGPLRPGVCTFRCEPRDAPEIETGMVMFY